LIVIDTTRIESVRQVLEKRKDEILAAYRAVGVGIGKQKPTDPSYVIVVYLESRSDLPGGAVSIDGVPLKFEVTGPIRPLSQSGR
jgi:hypothetical protein